MTACRWPAVCSNRCLSRSIGWKRTSRNFTRNSNEESKKAGLLPVFPGRRSSRYFDRTLTPMRTVRFHRLALVEIRKALRWYSTRSEWAARGLLDELRNAVISIGEAAETCPVEIKSVRWKRLKKYNYVLYCAILDESQCEIVAVSHG